ncbi:hypothetical protein VP01_105g2 [Puccinia sorghi]|uniref:Uncharacterized protein n=1 Tax=Puccinia sorghi TaxID=27349 RepID=A0A0L6VTX4_9BASI|nr:hypothetical protein VP01_105g2 [Puccinia sorghi]
MFWFFYASAPSHCITSKEQHLPVTLRSQSLSSLPPSLFFFGFINNQNTKKKLILKPTGSRCPQLTRITVWRAFLESTSFYLLFSFHRATFFHLVLIYYTLETLLSDSYFFLHSFFLFFLPSFLFFLLSSPNSNKHNKKRIKKNTILNIGGCIQSSIFLSYPVQRMRDWVNVRSSLILLPLLSPRRFTFVSVITKKKKLEDVRYRRTHITFFFFFLLFFSFVRKKKKNKKPVYKRAHYYYFSKKKKKKEIVLKKCNRLNLLSLSNEFATMFATRVCTGIKYDQIYHYVIDGKFIFLIIHWFLIVDSIQTFFKKKKEIQKNYKKLKNKVKNKIKVTIELNGLESFLREWPPNAVGMGALSSIKSSRWFGLIETSSVIFPIQYQLTVELLQVSLLELVRTTGASSCENCPPAELSTKFAGCCSIFLFFSFS